MFAERYLGIYQQHCRPSSRKLFDQEPTRHLFAYPNRRHGRRAIACYRLGVRGDTQ
jgi:hypothetical protein